MTEQEHHSVVPYTVYQMWSHPTKFISRGYDWLCVEGGNSLDFTTGEVYHFSEMPSLRKMFKLTEGLI
jgi:hypothetical protein